MLLGQFGENTAKTGQCVWLGLYPDTSVSRLGKDAWFLPGEPSW